MTEILMAHSGPIGGGHTMLVFLPLLPMALGLLFIVIAMRDKNPANQQHSVRKLPNPKEMPLRHVHATLAATRRKPRTKAEDEERRERIRSLGNRPNLKRVV